MVTKLTGNVNGNAVIFERIQGDKWRITVPRDLSGTYIVDLLAEDEAGNETYWARYILTVDLTALCVHLVPCPYQVEVLPERYYATVKTANCGGGGRRECSS